MSGTGSSFAKDETPLFIHDGVAWGVPGVGSGRGYGEESALARSAFSGRKGINRAAHIAGGFF